MNGTGISADPRQWLTLHDKCLFAKAYPAQKDEYLAAIQTLHELKQVLDIKMNAGQPGFERLLEGSGIPGTVTIGSYSFAISKWLAETFPGETSIDSSEADPETIRLFFTTLLPGIEFSAVSEDSLSLLKRIRQVKGKSPGTDLAWLIRLLDKSPLPDRSKEALFQGLRMYIRWVIRHPVYNKTDLKGINVPVFIHRRFLRDFPCRTIIAKELPGPVKPGPAEQLHLVNTARATLVFLHRETEPFSYAAAEGVLYFPLERGLTVVLFEMERERRLSVESYIGYLALKNGVPVAYGGGWIFGKRCQFGINILPVFRGGESLYLFCQLLRVYASYYRAEQFVVKPYQFGARNREALESGAVWFYYKAGFRSAAKHTGELMEEEWMKKNKEHSYRSAIPVLKAMTGAPMLLNLSEKKEQLPDAASLSRQITGFINSRYQGNRDLALKAALSFTRRQLGPPASLTADPFHLRAWNEWSLLVHAFFDLSAWTKREKQQLKKLILLKGSLWERDFILALQGHTRFWEELKLTLKDSR